MTQQIWSDARIERTLTEIEDRTVSANVVEQIMQQMRDDYEARPVMTNERYEQRIEQLNAACKQSIAHIAELEAQVPTVPVDAIRELCECIEMLAQPSPMMYSNEAGLYIDDAAAVRAWLTTLETTP